MDISAVSVSVVVVSGWLITVVGLVAFILGKFSTIEKDQLRYAGEAGILKEGLRQRIEALEADVAGFNKLLDKLDAQAKIQTDLLLKLGELTIHVKALQTGQEELSTHMVNGLAALSKGKADKKGISPGG